MSYSTAVSAGCVRRLPRAYSTLTATPPESRRVPETSSVRHACAADNAGIATVSMTAPAAARIIDPCR
jgi:hypothetical protein